MCWSSHHIPPLSQLLSYCFEWFTALLGIFISFYDCKSAQLMSHNLSLVSLHSIDGNGDRWSLKTRKEISFEALKWVIPNSPSFSFSHFWAARWIPYEPIWEFNSSKSLQTITKWRSQPLTDWIRPHSKPFSPPSSNLRDGIFMRPSHLELFSEMFPNFLVYLRIYTLLSASWSSNPHMLRRIGWENLFFGAQRAFIRFVHFPSYPPAWRLVNSLAWDRP